MSTRNTYTVKLIIPEQACMDILCTAAESGSNYWLGDYPHEWRRIQFEGKSYSDYAGLKIGNARKGSEAEGTDPMRKRINSEDIAKAITRMVELAGKPDGCHQRYVGDLLASIDDDGCSADADTCDIVLQLAVFGKVIYG
jgi:hypothetical protein